MGSGMVGGGGIGDDADGGAFLKAVVASGDHLAMSGGQVGKEEPFVLFNPFQNGNTQGCGAGRSSLRNHKQAPLVLAFQSGIQGHAKAG